MTSEEIKLAFKIACSGGIEVETNHYQNFNAEYLGRILSAYKALKQTKLSRTMGATTKTLQEQPLDRLKHYTEKLFNPFEELKRGNYTFSEMDERFLYRSIDKMGIVIATLEQKKEAMKEAEEQEPKGYRQDPYERARKVTNRAIRICFRNWIEDCALNDINVQELITKKIQ